MSEEQKYEELRKQWLNLEITDFEFKTQAQAISTEFWARAITCIGRGRTVS